MTATGSALLLLDMFDSGPQHLSLITFLNNGGAQSSARNNSTQGAHMSPRMYIAEVYNVSPVVNDALGGFTSFHATAVELFRA